MDIPNPWTPERYKAANIIRIPAEGEWITRAEFESLKKRVDALEALQGDGK